MLFRSQKIKPHKSVGVLIVCHLLPWLSWRGKWRVSWFSDFIHQFSQETKPRPQKLGNFVDHLTPCFSLQPVLNPHCGNGAETAEHLLLYCPKMIAERQCYFDDSTDITDVFQDDENLAAFLISSGHLPPSFIGTNLTGSSWQQQVLAVLLAVEHCAMWLSAGQITVDEFNQKYMAARKVRLCLLLYFVLWNWCDCCVYVNPRLQWYKWVLNEHIQYALHTLTIQSFIYLYSNLFFLIWHSGRSEFD